MTKVKKVPERSGSRHRRASPYSLRSFHSKIMKDTRHKKQRKASDKDWQDAKCSVCMEYPHNAVLLLCSSYHKGCRPYMCATSYRYSNCLDQYQKAYTKVDSTQSAPPWEGSIDDPNFNLGSDGASEKSRAPELLCPLCRGQVKGWTVVERARKFLNSKKRSCMQDNCSFVGSYGDLRKHVRADHPLARPREVDPSLAEKWKKLENDRELNDVMSTINSTMPGSIIMGDYVIEGNFRGFPRDDNVDNYLDSVLFRLGSYDGRRNARSGYAIVERGRRSLDDDEDDGDGGIEVRLGGAAPASGRARNYIPRIGRRQSRMFLSGSRRRRDGVPPAGIIF
ncbi:hypothetical protein L6452_16793 [Arctium lappa]|uniref:Uncharacterized protein n=1 Tax=Arctium lappa TaxID=4217 RepID=A0ACB9C1H8_ARCLA|nr:hypothetical protein L6452_16793 [Arctium lappa]